VCRDTQDVMKEKKRYQKIERTIWNRTRRIGMNISDS